MKGAIGLTGGIACGKSEVAGFLTHTGVPVLDTDLVARELLSPNHWVYEKVIEVFGKSILNEEGIIDRHRFGAQIFSNEEARKQLNGIMHPVVYREVEQWLEQKLRDHRHAVAMIPLLFETNAQEKFKKVLVVASDEELMVQRMRTRGLSPEEAKLRIDAQMPVAQKVALADEVIWNNGSLEELKQTTLDIWNKHILERK